MTTQVPRHPKQEGLDRHGQTATTVENRRRSDLTSVSPGVVVDEVDQMFTVPVCGDRLVHVAGPPCRHGVCVRPVCASKGLRHVGRCDGRQLVNHSRSASF